MFSIYTLLLYIHILSAVLSIGPLFVVLPIVKKMRTASNGEMPPYIESFKGAIAIVKHSGHVLVVSGILLMWHAGYHWSTSWIVLTFLVMLASIVFLARAFKPTLRTFNTPTYNHQRFVALLQRKAWMYILLLLIMLWLMVAKPIIW